MSRVGITIEGGLFAADLIERIALGEEGIKGQSARDFDIEPGRLSAELQSAFSDVRQAWEVFKRRREFSQASPVTVTREAWIYPLFERLDYMLRFQRAASQAGGQSYLISHHLGEAESATPVHTVSFDQRLDERGGQQRSPHALLQEYLNRSDALWGIVTNGRELRLLRNSARSSRPSYLAIDLEAIVEGNLYSEFALVYRLLHRSRLPEDGGDPHDCLLETWYQQSIEEGGRVRLGLRVGVKAALEILGSGFLRHQGNDALRAKIADGRLTEAHLYRELLSLIYRLLFLMVAEERRLLAAPGADARHDVYLRWYGIGRLRERAERRVGEDAYGDLWEGLKETFRVFREEAAAAALGLSALMLKAGVPDAALKQLTSDDKAVCTELRRRNKREREAPLDTFSAETVLAGLAGEFAALADMPDRTPGDVRSKADLYRELVEGNTAIARLRGACDAWTAVFFVSRAASQARVAPTTADVWNALNGQPNPQRAATIDELRQRFHFFHWRLEFPEVFDRGGFDVMVGNPPWERIKLLEKEFFTGRDDEIANAPNKAARERLIRRLSLPEASLVNKTLAIEFEKAKRNSESKSLFFRESNRFGLTAIGDINSYAVFAETFLKLIDSRGRAGLILPLGIATDETTKTFFEEISTRNRLVSIFAFENEEFIFKSVHHSFKFCLLTAQGEHWTANDQLFVFFARRPDALRDQNRQYTLSADDIRRINPNTKTAPIFRSKADAQLVKQIYDRVPVLIDDSESAVGNPWLVGFSTMFHMSNDSGLFRTSRQLAAEGFRRDGVNWLRAQNERWVPLYEAKMLDLFDHRAASYSSRGDERGFRILPDTSIEEHAAPHFDIEPFYWVSSSEIDARLSQWNRRWLLGFKDVSTPITERSFIATVFPRVGAGNSIPLLMPSPSFEPGLVAALYANLSCLPFDYVARQKIGGLHFNFFVVKQLPVLPPTAFAKPARSFIVLRVLELTYTAQNIAPFAEDLGYDGPPFPWDPDRRALLKAELDAYFAYLYGLSRDELRYILDPQDVMGAAYPSETFRVLKENEVKAYGEYRTRRLVLEAWDRFAEDGTFDPARLQDPTHFDVVRRALVETRERVGALERERDELAALLKRSDATPLPTLFVEGESDVAILTAAWRAFYPTENPPVTILAAGGTRQMESLAGRGGALRQLLGDRLVFALADNDREGRALVEDGRTRKGGVWRQQSNGIHWCLLAPTPEFEQAMKRFTIDATYWPFTIENAFLAALRRRAIDEGAYGIDEATVQPAFLEDAATSTRAMRAAHQLAAASDDAVLYFRPPAPETKLAFAEWIAAPERRDRATFAAFGPILEGLQAILAADLDTPRLQDRPNPREVPG